MLQRHWVRTDHDTHSFYDEGDGHICDVVRRGGLYFIEFEDEIAAQFPAMIANTPTTGFQSFRMTIGVVDNLWTATKVGN
jgi:hypothetical protein